MYVGPFTLAAATLNAAVTTLVGEGSATLAYTVVGLAASGATLTLEASDDMGATWNAVRFMGTAVLAGATTLTADGIYSVAAGGHTNMRLRVSTAGAGSITIGYNASTGVRAVNLEGTGTGPLNPLIVATSVSVNSTGASQYSKLATADTNAAVIKASKGKVLGYQIFNNTAAAKFVRLYNKATVPNPASDAALIVRRIMVPASGVAAYSLNTGLDGFTNGIAIDATGALADIDTTALAANDLTINVDYV